MKKVKAKSGFSLVEILLSIAVFALIVMAMTGSFIYGKETTATSGMRQRASLIAEEGLEATRNIRDNAFSNLVDGTYSLSTTSGKWNLISSPNTDTTDIFTRQITVATVDSKRKQITSTVNWTQNGQRSGQIVLKTYLNNWMEAVAASKKNGVLVYGDGGTTTDSVLYKTFNATTGVWSAASAVTDIDGTTTNRSLRVAKLYSSSTRNEKVLITRHFAASNPNINTQYIYATVFNGTTWGTPQLLTSWSAATFLDVQNFDGTYLSNGDFMAIYSINTNIPQMRIWNGSTWGSQIATQNVGGIPNYIITKMRPGTNEVMTATMDNQNDTNSEYFSGGAYATASWTLHTEHSAQAPVNTKRMIDFEWSPFSPTIGLLAYSNNQNDRSVRYKLFTANGTGGGSWGSQINGTNEGVAATRLGVIDVTARSNAGEFSVCSQNTVPQIICYRMTTTGTLANPTNPIIASTTDNGIQKTYDTDYERSTGTYSINIYSDATNIAKLKKYDPATNTYDLNATTVGTLGGTLKSTRILGQASSNDLMAVMADSNRALYTIAWDGTAHALYSTPAGYALTSHGTNGSAITDYWFDYAWDIF